MVPNYLSKNRGPHQTAFKKLKGDNKKLLIVAGANHTDLYDTDKIPFDAIVDFYRHALA